MDPDDVAAAVQEVTALSDIYEDALKRRDLAVLDGLFADDPRLVRFGIRDMQHSYAELVAWRATAPGVNPQRIITRRDAHALGPGVVAVDLTFDDGDPAVVGRQSQTWVRLEEGWRILRAHVPLAPIVE